MPSTHEQTVNVALGEVLGGLRKSWQVDAEKTGGVLQGGGRPDVLVEEASGWPVVIEAELSDHAGAEKDATARLGRTVAATGRSIETAVALLYPSALHNLDGQALRTAIGEADDFEYALYTRRPNQDPERLPATGWLRGTARDLAMLLHRASIPAQRVDELAQALEGGVEQAANAFPHAYGGEHGSHLAKVLGQADDNDGQTRRMAMTVILNALVFHEALAEAGFEVGPEDERRAVRPVRTFLQHGNAGGPFEIAELLAEWQAILERNYWPIFASAREMLLPMPEKTADAVLRALWSAAARLIRGGVTRSHDLTGVVFQKLIADRKFLATYYTQPAAAALLAGLALPSSRAPGGADWSDAETLQALQIGDFACGTGTLLSAAYQRLSLLHELHGGDPKALHAPMMKHGLVGLDVLNIAVHLTAAMLAGSHPDTPFDGECLLTMRYGKEAAIGSLELLAESVWEELIGQAAAVTAGGRRPQDVRDLVTRVQHGKFDLLIMNPPFTRPTNHEASHANVPIPSYAAFDTTTAEQRKMAQRVRSLTKGAPSNDNAGLASHFVELAHRKARPGGSVALVLPLSAVSGGSWGAVREQWCGRYINTIVVSIAGAGSDEASFSADTGMAECLLIAQKNGVINSRARGFFAVLTRQPSSALHGELVASAIRRAVDGGQVQHLEARPGAGTPIEVGGEYCGYVLDCPIEGKGDWPLVGIADASLAQTAYQLVRGRLFPLNEPMASALAIPIVPIGEMADRGPVDRDIGSDNYDGTLRGPFEVLKPARQTVPTYPVLWAHDAKKERGLVVAPDSEGQIKSAVNQSDINEKAARLWEKATRAHYNRDLQFNSQSLIVAMTERKCIGGRAWPSVIFKNPAHEYAFALWCNSTLGLLLHWWTSNKTQSGRGTTTVTEIPNIPALDVRALDEEQHRWRGRRSTRCRTPLPSIRPDRRGFSAGGARPAAASRCTRPARVAVRAGRDDGLAPPQARRRAANPWRQAHPRRLPRGDHRRPS